MAAVGKVAVAISTEAVPGSTTEPPTAGTSVVTVDGPGAGVIGGGGGAGTFVGRGVGKGVGEDDGAELGGSTHSKLPMVLIHTRNPVQGSST